MTAATAAFRPAIEDADPANAAEAKAPPARLTSPQARLMSGLAEATGARGGIGRRARFRSVFRKEWWFDSTRAHHLRNTRTAAQTDLPRPNPPVADPLPFSLRFRAAAA
jgi:hypothetical protein